MHRQPPLAAAVRRPVWLLLALAVAALGLWSGGHCAEDHAAHSGAYSGPVLTSHAGLPGPDIDRAAADHRTPISADDDCHVDTPRSIGSAPSTVASVIPLVRGEGRINPDDRPRPVQPPPSGITLSAIGVSRT